MFATPSAMPTTDQRTLRAGDLVASYYTSEPGPSRWIAVATIAAAARDAPAHARALRLLVGAGDSEAAAIEHLHRRLAALDA